jgi:hypothetical protein
VEDAIAQIEAKRSEQAGHAHAESA